MGTDAVRHLRTRTLANGDIAHFWVPSRTLEKLGMSCEALGTDPRHAESRALELNHLADAARRGRALGCRPQQVRSKKMYRFLELAASLLLKGGGMDKALSEVVPLWPG